MGWEATELARARTDPTAEETSLTNGTVHLLSRRRRDRRVSQRLAALGGGSL